MKKCCLYCLVLLVVYGCQSNVTREVAYPETWPEYFRDDACASIDGLYAYEGQKYSGGEYNDVMSGMGPAIGGYLINGVPRLVEIRVGDNPVSHVFNIYGDRMSSLSEQNSRYKHVSDSLIIIEKKLQCIGDRYIEEYDYNSAAEGMAHKGRIVYYYSKDIEGSLVIAVTYINTSSGSLFIFNKKTVTGNVWYKFKNITK